MFCCHTLPFSSAAQVCEPYALLQFQGKRKADMVEALLGALYLTAAAQEDIELSSSDRGSSKGANASLVSRAGLLAAAQFCERLGMVKPGV